VVPAFRHIHSWPWLRSLGYGYVSLCLQRGCCHYLLAALRRRHHLDAFSTDLLRRLTGLLHSEFAMTDLGDLHHFLGISVTLVGWPLSVSATVCGGSPPARRHGRVSLHVDTSGHSCQAVGHRWSSGGRRHPVSESGWCPSVLDTNAPRPRLRCSAGVPLHARSTGASSGVAQADLAICEGYAVY